MLDDEQRYRAVHSRDGRFDGWFVTAVTSTGIYCRPSCPAVTPKRGNVRFYATAAAAQLAGFRACRRCRPDATPGSPEWNVRADVVARAMRLIADGVVDRDGVDGLARRLGYSERHLHRLLVAEVGAGPQALARAQRAQTARILLETTDLPIGATAFAAGFASVRQFNDTIRQVFAATPTLLRRSASRRGQPTPGSLALRLPVREPFAGQHLLDFLGRRAVAGVEEYVDGRYRRTLDLPHGPAVTTLTVGEPGSVRCQLQLTDLRDLPAAVYRCRRLLDLDADPVAVDAALSADPLLRPLVAENPGLRVPGCVDGAELAVRAVLGQQVSVAAAKTAADRLVTRFGKPLTNSTGALTSLFPRPAELAAAHPGDLPMPAARRTALLRLTALLADGQLRLDPGADRDAVEQDLLPLPGLGPWSVGYIKMRALGDPDVYLSGDGGVQRTLRQLPTAPSTDRWRPWRSYAVQHLWANPERKSA